MCELCRLVFTWTVTVYIVDLANIKFGELECISNWRAFSLVNRVNIRYVRILWRHMSVGTALVGTAFVVTTFIKECGRHSLAIVMCNIIVISIIVI